MIDGKPVIIRRQAARPPTAILAGQNLVARLEGESAPPRYVVVSTKLVPRGSGKIAASDGG